MKEMLSLSVRLAKEKMGNVDDAEEEEEEEEEIDVAAVDDEAVEVMGEDDAAGVPTVPTVAVPPMLQSPGNIPPELLQSLLYSWYHTGYLTGYAAAMSERGEVGAKRPRVETDSEAAGPVV